MGNEQEVHILQFKLPSYDRFVACAECERLAKLVIEYTRANALAQSRLEAFTPEPPFGQVAANELHALQRMLEDSRTALDDAEHRRVAHVKSHLLTLSR